MHYSIVDRKDFPKLTPSAFRPGAGTTHVPIFRINFSGPKDVQAIIILYLYDCSLTKSCASNDVLHLSVFFPEGWRGHPGG